VSVTESQVTMGEVLRLEAELRAADECIAQAWDASTSGRSEFTAVLLERGLRRINLRKEFEARRAEREEREAIGRELKKRVDDAAGKP
jgi:hypothetical protein